MSESPETTSRETILRQMLQDGIPSTEALRNLELTALQDSDPEIRKLAVQILASPAGQQAQQQAGLPSPYVRGYLLQEITAWQTQGLIPLETAQVLTARYASPQTRTAARSAQRPAQEQLSLRQVLLSETAVQVALYLGAFLFISAALLFAALLPDLRMFILGLTIFLTGAAAAALFPRLRMASFVFFNIMTFLVYVQGAVIIEEFNLDDPVAQFFNSLVMAIGTLIWSGGVLLYRSRWFSMCALVSGGLAGLAFANGLGFEAQGVFLLWAAATLGLAIPGIAWMKQWPGGKAHYPLVITSHLMFVFIQLTTLFSVIVEPPGIRSDSLEANWILAGLVFLISALYWLGCSLLLSPSVYPWLVGLTLLPIPALIIQPVWESLQAAGVAWTIWSVISLLVGEVLARLPWKPVQRYGGGMTLGAILAGLLGGVFALSESAGLASALFMISGTGVIIAHLVRVSGLRYLSGLALVWFGYLCLLFSDGMRELDLPLAWTMSLPPAILLTLHLIASRRKANPAWDWPPAILGMISLVLPVAYAFGLPEELAPTGPNPQAGVLFFWAVYTAGYALLLNRPWVNLAGALAAYAGLGVWLFRAEASQWLLPLTGLALAFSALGWILLRWRSQSAAWGKSWLWSGLIGGALIGLLAPLQEGPMAILCPALLAGAWAIEALRQRNVWLGFAVNGLLLVAYFTALVRFEVDQPQAFSIGAGLLALVQHYLLRRIESRWGAGLTGILAQLTLLTVSYAQMLGSEQFLYFGVLFFQALVLLVYGVLARLRSFIAVPVIFIVVGVFTVIFSNLQGLPALVLTGCAGALLLTLGVIALALRSRNPRPAASQVTPAEEEHGQQ